VIDRRTLVAFAGGTLVLKPFAALGQSVAKTYRIGYLDPRSSTITADDPSYTSLRRTLGDLGYATGRNMIFEERFADRQIDRLPALASELVQRRVDVIIAASAPSIRASLDATKSIPIVMAFSGDDPVKSGFVKSLAHPGGNVTGVTILFGELAPKWVELMRDLVPGMTRLAVMSNASRPAHAEYFATMLAQRPPGLRLQHVEVRAPDQYEAAFSAMSAERAEGLVILADILFTQDAVRLAQLAIQHRLPSINQFREFALKGGLMAYGPEEGELAVLAAHFVDKLLKGGKPDELPVQQPTKFRLTLNVGTAKLLNLVVPPLFQLRVDDPV